tara:strand:- start:109854 stop:110015 length:162 start_codon:yes stop_codon:yes gene_type:complete
LNRSIDILDKFLIKCFRTLKQIYYRFYLTDQFLLPGLSPRFRGYFFINESGLI